MAEAVYLHIGVPKTGSTFVQEVLWTNRERLAELGYDLAADTYTEHTRAMADLCGRRSGTKVQGAWRQQVERFRSSPARAILSQEQLCRASLDLAGRAVGDLAPTDVTVVMTVRDMVRQVTSYWQQQVKSRYAGSLADMAELIRSRTPTDDDFWGHQDVLTIADRWRVHVPVEHFVVVTLPPPGAPPEVLWRRFAASCGLDPDGFDLEVQRPNESLGAAQVEVLRRINEALGDRLPLAGGYAAFRRLVANELLARQPEYAPLELDEATHAWATDQSRRWIDGLRARDVRVIGDLAELEPSPWAAQPIAAGPSEAAVARSAVAVIADLVAQRESRGPRGGRRHSSGLGGAHRRDG